MYDVILIINVTIIECSYVHMCVRMYNIAIAMK